MPRKAASLSGSAGWDEYAAFYDWENARTMARRDVPFWRRVAAAAEGPVLELGCGTGRVTVPLARAGIPLVGIDLSSPMLHRARTRLRRTRLAARARLVRGDIRRLPFAPATFRARRGALRHPAVTGPRPRSRRNAERRRRGAPPWRPARDGARRRLAGLARVPRRNQAPRMASRAARAPHAGGIGPPGSAARPHHLRPGVHRAPRTRRRRVAASRSPSARSRCRRWRAGSSAQDCASRRALAATTAIPGPRESETWIF